MARFMVILVFLFTMTHERVCAVSETASAVWHSVHSGVKSLGEDAHSYLVSLLGQQTVDTLLKTIEDGIKVTSQATAHTLNVAATYITNFLGAWGIDAKLPIKHFSPEGVIFVAKWALLAVLGYWLLSWAVCLLAGVVRQTLFLLKVAFAIATFGLIVSDTGASSETTAIRLGGLVLTCVLLGVGPSPFRGDSSAHLEKKVKVLERRLRELEKKEE